MESARDAGCILAVNGGSSSLKFAVYDLWGGERLLLSGEARGIGRADSGVTVRPAGGQPREERVALADHAAALEWLVHDLERSAVLPRLQAAGHRFVHGGPTHVQPVRITPEVLATLRAMIPLAPAHLPDELRAVETLARLLPALPQVACFDTAFHAGMPRAARWFGIPRALSEQGVVRYGFHGLSCEYVVQTLRAEGTNALGRRAVIAHLGHGASATAVLDGASVDTSMGLTPLGGFVMGNRSGDLDPGVVLYLLRGRGMSADDVAAAVGETGGLLGVSETSGDMRDLLARRAEDPRAADAIAMFCHQVRKCIGGYAAVLGGLDTLVFTGGIGEHAAPIRAEIADGLGHLGVELDRARNLAGAPRISAAGSRVTVRVVQTNEEIMIVRHARSVLAS